MPKVKRELRNVSLATKVSQSTSDKAVAKCEKKQLSLSAYINSLIVKDLGP